MRDVREWLTAIDELGELQRVDGADWNLEIGGISELNYRRRPPAALLFDLIDGIGLAAVKANISERRERPASRKPEHADAVRLDAELAGARPDNADGPLRVGKRFPFQRQYAVA